MSVLRSNSIMGDDDEGNDGLLADAAAEGGIEGVADDMTGGGGGAGWRRLGDYMEDG